MCWSSWNLNIQPTPYYDHTKPSKELHLLPRQMVEVGPCATPGTGNVS